MNARVTIEELSRLIDGEVSDAERLDIERRISACPVSQAMRNAFAEITHSISAATLRQPLPSQMETPTSDCLDADTLAQIADGHLMGRAKTAAEDHIMQCEVCLAVVLDSLRTSRRMARGDWPAIPKDIAEEREVRLIIHAQERESDQEEWSTAEVDVTQDQPASAAFSSGSFSARIVLTPLPRHRARVEMLLKDRRSPKRGVELILTNSETHRKVFTGNSDADGNIRIARLPAGRYQAHFRGQDLKIEILVSAAPPQP